MIVESLVILALLVFTFVISLRFRKEYAVAITPLMILPLSNIIAHLIVNKIFELTGDRNFLGFFFIYVMGVVVTSVLVGIQSLKFKTRATKFYYIIMSIVFTIALFLVFLLNYAK